jgi:hypothetical protein
VRTIIIRSLVVFVSTVAAVGVLVWPWPAPEVDWRTPVEQALAKGDCKTAVTIADAAAGAGSREAYEIVRGLVNGGKCERAARDRAGWFHAFVMHYQSSDATGDVIYGLSGNDLGFPRRYFFSAGLFLCASPYNGVHQFDNAALSDVVPASRGLVMDWHRFRRQTCLTVLERLAEQLVDDGDAPAHEVATNILLSPPKPDTPQADFLLAQVVLERSFVPHRFRGDEVSIKRMRDLAWLKLESSAEHSNAAAVRLAITLLHEGWFRTRDDVKAYYWVLRLRRLGLPGAPIDTEIERGLSEAERESARTYEDAMWSTRHSDGVVDSNSSQ